MDSLSFVPGSIALSNECYAGNVGRSLSKPVIQTIEIKKGGAWSLSRVPAYLSPISGKKGCGYVVGGV